MSKLQCIKRVNGSLVYSVNIPLDLIESLYWIKGEELEILIADSHFGNRGIIISKVD